MKMNREPPPSELLVLPTDVAERVSPKGRGGEEDAIPATRIENGAHAPTRHPPSNPMTTRVGR